MTETIQQFQQALDVLLSPTFQTAGQHQQANLWLNSFAKTPQAWEAALAVLQQPAPLSNAHQFFAANLLLSKARLEWSRLSEEQKAHVSNAISACLQLPLDHLALQRIILVRACISVREGAQGVDQFCASALYLAASAQSPDQLRYALVMLSEVRAEVSGLDIARAKAATQAMANHLHDMCALVQQVTVNAGVAGGPPVLLAAVRCFHAWCDSMGMASAGSTITLSQLHTSFPALFSNMFVLIADGNTLEDTRHECTQAMVMLLATACEDGSAIVDAAAALAAHQSSIADPNNEAGARSVAALATAISDGASDFTAGVPPPDVAEGPAQEAAVNVALQLAELVLACIRRPELAVTDAALDYFININTVPLSNRAEPLKSGLYAQALPLLVPKASYPPGFTNWEEAEGDEDSFKRFRDHQLSEVLECCCAMLGPKTYLDLVAPAAAAASIAADHWRNFEASLFCVRAVSMPVKVYILGKDRGSLGTEPRSAQHVTNAAYASVALASVFSLIAGSVPHMQNPWVLKEACRLIGEFTAWLDQGRTGVTKGLPAEAARLGAEDARAALQAAPPPPLTSVLTVLIRGLTTPQAATNAAQALRNVCARCGDALCDPQILQGLMEGAMRVVAPPPHQPLPPFFPELAERQSVMEGLARVVSALPASPSTQGGLSMADGSLALTAPLLERARAAAQTGTLVNPAALKNLAEDLRLLASALRFMDAYKGPATAPLGQVSADQPAMKVLQAAWPVLEGVAAHPACQREPEVVAAVSEVYQRALVSTRSAGHVLLPPLLSATTTLFNASHHPGCCDVLGTVAEMFGEVRNADVAALQVGAVAGIIAATYSLLRGGVDASHHGDLIRALYQMADRYLVFARDVLLDVPSLAQLVALAPPAVRQREREPVVGALVFIGRLFGTAGKAFSPEQRPQLDRLTACLASEGPKIVTSLLLATADSLSRQLARPLAGALWSILQCEALGCLGREWVLAAVQGPEFAGVCTNVLPTEEAGRFCAALVRVPPLPRGRFDALVGDLSAVLRGEAGADVVLAYEM